MYHKDDVIAELLVILYNAIDKYDPSKASIYTYLYRVMRTKLIDKMRTQSTVKKYLVDTDTDEIIATIKDKSTDNIYTNELFELTQKSLYKLTNTQKELVTRRYIDGETISNIIKKMKISRQKYGYIHDEAILILKKDPIMQELWSNIKKG